VDAIANMGKIMVLVPSSRLNVQAHKSGAVQKLLLEKAMTVPGQLG
jgi:hypothetical protein